MHERSGYDLVKFDHMALPVSNVAKSRDWYVKNLDFKVEFENHGITAIQDSAGFTIFLTKASKSLAGEKVTLTIQVKSVDRKHKELAAIGMKFVNPHRTCSGAMAPNSATPTVT
jgi:catechol 2,3-dioxygenase-like lactoylglutathione lyase family enzyme